ncbi:unnamed protein product [Pedinophyceae sp. YPF-701]|nr:unnamed protein product [Pedinophyceae sp. YPF-701]
MGVSGALRIRLARGGFRHKPFYRIFVAQKEAPVQGRHMDILGYFKPEIGPDGNRQMGIKFDRLRYWLARGATPSDRVAWLLHVAGVLPEPPQKGYYRHRPDLLHKSREEIRQILRSERAG